MEPLDYVDRDEVPNNNSATTISISYIHVKDEDDRNNSWNITQPDDHQCQLITKQQYEGVTQEEIDTEVTMCPRCRACRASSEHFYVDIVPYSPLLKLFANSVALDYEVCAFYEVLLFCTDRSEQVLYQQCIRNAKTSSDNSLCLSHGLTSKLVIALNDVPETPKGVVSNEFRIKENSESGTFVGKLIVEDEDFDAPNTSYIYVINNETPMTGRFRRQQFYIYDATIYVLADNINYELTARHSIELNISVMESLTLLGLDIMVTIHVDDVNEAPCCLAIEDHSHITIPRTLRVGSQIGTLQVIPSL